MATQKSSRSLLIRWTSHRGLIAFIVFLAVAVLIEFLVVIYAITLGVTDPSVLQWSFIFPGTSTMLTLAFSPLFEMIPIVVILALASMWAYLTRQVAIRTPEMQRRRADQHGKKSRTSFLSRLNVATIFGKRIQFARATIRSGLMVFVIFVLLAIVVSLFAYPQLIYQIVTNAYRTNPGLLDFFKGTGAAFSSIGTVFAGIDSALLSGSAGLRDFILGVGSIISPLANSDNAGKYLAIQNGSVWITAIIVIIYGRYGRRRIVQLRKR
jgi:hypothetical protein